MVSLLSGFIMCDSAFDHIKLFQLSLDRSPFSAIADRVNLLYLTSEPRFSAIFLGTLVPSAFGNERLYYLVGITMIGGLILCQMYFYNALFHDLKLTFIVTSVQLMLQILCVPYPTESFYWYVGSVNYTFINSLSLVLIILFFKLSTPKPTTKPLSQAILYIITLILAVLVSGNNFGTSLSRLCLFSFFSLVWFFSNKKKLFRTLPITITMLIGLVICLISPGSDGRLATEYAEAGYGAVEAIWRSIYHSFIAVYSYTKDIKMILAIFLMLPFVIYGLQKSELFSVISFRYPLFFTLITLLLYASELVPNYYVEGAVRAQRMADIYYYEYFLFMMTNLIYWTGWIIKGDRKYPSIFAVLKEHLVPYLIILSLCLITVFALKDFRNSSSYRASVWLIRGYAAEYRATWEARLTQLKDPSIQNVTFEPIDLPCELIYYTDVTEDSSNWINRICADYYGKESVVLKSKN